MKLIPAIDLLYGDVVRLYQGDYEQRTRFAQEPAAIAQAYYASGATLLHLVDLNAARQDEQDNLALVEEIVRAAPLPVQTGGGIRDEARLEKLLATGVQRVVIGSLAVKTPELVRRWLQRFGPDRIVLALDVRVDHAGEPRLLTEGWQEEGGGNLWPLLEEYVQAGLVHLLCTDISRDGTLAGTNVGLYVEITRRYPVLQLQASGGIGSLDDVAALQAANIPAAILGRALLERRFTLEEAAIVARGSS